VSMASASRMRSLFGFEMQDTSGWSRVVSLLHRPCDPAGLALFRIGYGLLMAVDIVEERGLSYADYKWGDPGECRFPLLHFLGVLPLPWMYIVYLAMFLAAVGICVGAFYRVSCVTFTCCYWYIFLLDKLSWNNHSYLYGLVALLLLNTDAHRYWSVDGWLRPSLRNSHIPLYHHALIRTQFFLVYFIAGLKKLDSDWVGGYSMGHLANHWMFSPFKLFLSEELVDLVVVHWCGLIMDLTVGFLLFFDQSRPLGMMMAVSFHAMNSQLFSIGMFSYVMLWGNLIFLHCDWPRRLLTYLPQCRLTADHPIQTNSACVYTGQSVIHAAAETTQTAPTTTSTKSSSVATAASVTSTTSATPTATSTKSSETTSLQQEPLPEVDPSAHPSSKPTLSRRHHVAAVCVLAYVIQQSFMPYSHFITQGYNNWTSGLYGYSWDMMIHSWSVQHIRLTYRDKITGEQGYLDPEAFTRQGRRRWSSHADMLLQYSECISKEMSELGHPDIEIYFDIWRSMNDRFQQRMFDPRVDILTADWHPFKVTPWLMPLLADLSDWRQRLAQLEKDIYNNMNDTEVVFVADFPGLSLENYIQADLKASLEVLNGQVLVEFEDAVNHSLTAGDTLPLPAGQYHAVHTVSTEPSCYMYIYTNQTERDLQETITAFQKLQDDTSEASSDDDTNTVRLSPEAQQALEELNAERRRKVEARNKTVLDTLWEFVTRKLENYQRSAEMTGFALKSILTGQDMLELVREANGFVDEQGVNVEPEVGEMSPHGNIVEQKVEL